MLIPISDLCKLPLIPNLVQALSCNSEEESAIVVVTVGSSLINVDNVEVTHTWVCVQLHSHAFHLKNLTAG